MAGVFTRGFYKICFSTQISPFGVLKENFEVLFKSRQMYGAIIFEVWNKLCTPGVFWNWGDF